MNVEMVKDLVGDGLLRYHHRAARQGYVSRRRPEGIAKLYRGRYGHGVIIMRPRWDTTRYIWVDYYIADNAETYAVLAAWKALTEEV